MINMAIIGFGRQGIGHAKWIAENKDLRLIAICEKNESRLENIKKEYKLDVYSDIDRLLNVKEIDYIVIATTNEFHEEYTIKSLQKEKNVIVEKTI